MRTSLISGLTAAALLLGGSGPALASAMVGAGVGSPDVLIAQGNKEYNEKKYSAARDDFLKAARANPTNAQVYLSLARAYMQTREYALACFSYRVFLKAGTASSDHDKAQNESEQCERTKANKHVQDDLGPKIVTQKANLKQAAEDGKLLGAGSAGETLQAMLAEGYASPDLSDMAAKVRTAAATKGNDGFTRALKREPMTPEELRSTAALLRLAGDVGETDATLPPKAHFVEGFADMQEKHWGQAEAEFKQSIGAGADKDAKFYAAIALYRNGDHKRAIRQLEQDLPDDPRTGLIKSDQAMAVDAKDGSKNLEKLLFSQAFKQSAGSTAP